MMCYLQNKSTDQSLSDQKKIDHARKKCSFVEYGAQTDFYVSDLNST
jgi:hypothetical protein